MTIDEKLELAPIERVRIENLIYSKQFVEAHSKIEYYRLNGYEVLNVQKLYLEKLKGELRT
jgi:hypothetical protein